MSAEPSPPTPPKPVVPHPDNLSVIVRPLPKVVYLYLVWLVSLLFGFWPGDLHAWHGQVWVNVFFLSAVVISFDFNEERSLILVLGVIAVFLAGLYFELLGPVGNWLSSLQPTMDRSFYHVIGGGFTIIYFFVWLNARFNYWEFRPNEVVHRYGIFPKMKRYSTEDMRWDKTVPDLFERLLLGTGTIILTTPHERHPVRLEHVMRIGRIDDRIADILGVKAVVHRESSADPHA
ncbi:MAG: hypothetical protein DHS20C15_11060 [Planctomycetota bacterium]|nr:MAG: hypothetical protein DHS20C15_11060 [Planctomycetota bacterium]